MILAVLIPQGMGVGVPLLVGMWRVLVSSKSQHWCEEASVVPSRNSTARFPESGFRVYLGTGGLSK